jgi:thiamine monophosphate synthase
LKEIVHKINLPVLAIGGIDKNNIHDVISTGVYGVAVISGVVKSDNPIEAVKEIKKILR